MVKMFTGRKGRPDRVVGSTRLPEKLKRERNRRELIGSTTGNEMMVWRSEKYQAILDKILAEEPNDADEKKLFDALHAAVFFIEWVADTDLPAGDYAESTLFQIVMRGCFFRWPLLGSPAPPDADKYSYPSAIGQ